MAKRRFFDTKSAQPPSSLAPITASAPPEPAHEIDQYRAQPREFNFPRPIAGSAARLNLAQARKTTVTRSTAAWQTAAWNYYSNISELQFAFNIVGQLISRITCHAAFIDDASHTPISCSEIRDSFEDKKGLYAGSQVLQGAQMSSLLIHDLIPPGLQSSFLQDLALNLCVAGEAYVVHNTYVDRYVVASVDELKIGGQGRSNNALRTSELHGTEVPLSDDAFVARVWRRHPRYSSDPISSMRGVLDACEHVLLIDQTIRAITRSNLNAGAVFIPSEMSGPEGQDVETALVEVTTAPVEDETSRAQVTPLFISGPAEFGKAIQRMEFARPLDPTLIQAQDRAIERVLRGIDVPKDIVSGLADIKYANAIAVDDNLFRAHIEPLILLICDSLTSVYLQPALRKAGLDPALAERFVVWYNPSAIVTRPDRSQAANEGFDRYLLSGDAWRTARGFSDLDAPTNEELIQRLVISKASIPPDMAGTLIESLAPEFFSELREETQSVAGMDDSLQQLLAGEALPADGTMPDSGAPNQDGSSPANPMPTPNTRQTAESAARGGGEVSPGGGMPPRNQ